MRLPFAALAFSIFAAGAASAFAEPSTSDTYQVQNPHGGYNVIQGKAPHQGIAVFGSAGFPSFFGANGYAAHVVKHSHDKTNFILVPVVQDEGHGNKIIVYKKLYYATPEEAEAAKAAQ